MMQVTEMGPASLTAQQTGTVLSLLRGKNSRTVYQWATRTPTANTERDAPRPEQQTPL